MDIVDCQNRLMGNQLEIEEERLSHEWAKELGHASIEAQSKDRGRSARESSRQMGRGEDNLPNPEAEEPTTHLGHEEENLPNPEPVAVTQDHTAGGQGITTHSRLNKLEPTIDHEMQCSDRIRRTPTHLNDYVWYGAQIEKPILVATPLQKGSSSKQYPITYYVTCANFSPSHQIFLAAITKKVGPKSYHEVAQNAS